MKLEYHRHENALEIGHCTASPPRTIRITFANEIAIFYSVGIDEAFLNEQTEVRDVLALADKRGTWTAIVDQLKLFFEDVTPLGSQGKALASHAYIAEDTNGCVHGLVVDLDSEPELVRSALREYLSEGWAVRRVTLEESRRMAENFCTCEGRCTRQNAVSQTL